MEETLCNFQNADGLENKNVENNEGETCSDLNYCDTNSKTEQTSVIESESGESVDSEEDNPNPTLKQKDEEKNLNKTPDISNFERISSKTTIKILFGQYMIFLIASLFGMNHSTSKNNISYALFVFQTIVCLISLYCVTRICLTRDMVNISRVKSAHNKNISKIFRILFVAILIECLYNISYYWYPLYILIAICLFPWPCKTCN